jgi:hypothetical protein
MQLACSSSNEAAPPFAVFERWAPQAPSLVLIRQLSRADSTREPKFSSGKSPDTIVPGTHPSKIAKGGAALVVAMQRWASPHRPAAFDLDLGVAREGHGSSRAARRSTTNHAAPWKSGASAPRKVPQPNRGFSPGPLPVWLGHSCPTPLTLPLTGKGTA